MPAPGSGSKASRSWAGMIPIPPLARARRRSSASPPLTRSPISWTGSISPSANSPTPAHADGATEALARGIHVLVEKPMASRPEDGERMLNAAHGWGGALRTRRAAQSSRRRVLAASPLAQVHRGPPPSTPVEPGTRRRCDPRPHDPRLDPAPRHAVARDRDPRGGSAGPHVQDRHRQRPPRVRERVRRESHGEPHSREKRSEDTVLRGSGVPLDRPLPSHGRGVRASRPAVPGEGASTADLLARIRPVPIDVHDADPLETELRHVLPCATSRTDPGRSPRRRSRRLRAAERIGRLTASLTPQGVTA